MVICLSRAWRTTCWTTLSCRRFQMGRGPGRAMKIWVMRWSRAKPAMAAATSGRVDPQVAGETHVPLHGLPLPPGRSGDVNRDAIGLEVIGHALSPANQDGGRRAAGEADENALAAAGGRAGVRRACGGVIRPHFPERR